MLDAGSLIDLERNKYVDEALVALPVAAETVGATIVVPVSV